MASAAAEVPVPVRIVAITLLMGLAKLVVTADFALVGIALPTIGRDLEIRPALLSWVVSANATMYAGFLIIGGRLTDALGHRRALGIGLLVFAAGSLLSALSGGIGMLIAARAVQGLGAALVSPASFSLINTFLPEGPARRRAFGVFAVMQGLSVIIGLVLGGFLTTVVGWRSVFFLNLPIVAVCLALTAAVLPRGAPTAARGALDNLGGAMLIVASTGVLLAALSNQGEHGLGSAPGLILLAAAVAGFLGFFALEARHASPLIPPGLLRDAGLRGAGLAVLALIAGFGGLFVLLSLYLQNGLQVSAATTGVSMTPIAFATMAAGACAPVLMKRWPLRTLAMAGLMLEVVALALLAAAAPTGEYLAVAPLAFLAVFGSVTAFVALMALALAAVPADEQGSASGLLFTGQQIGLPAGVVISLVVFQALPGAPAEGPLAAYGRAFLAPALLVALGLVAVAVLIRSPNRHARQPSASGEVQD